MTYTTYLLLFVVPPLLLVLWRFGDVLRDRGWAPLALLLVVVYGTTIPWDAWAIATGLWSFDPECLAGPHVWGIPIEEVAFFGLQTMLTGVWVLHRLAVR
ncbi:MAG TPA: lycopene cyclase domain-containing protein [Candidatus Binatia bacterium]|nr:lycopene cyclase domain-containing protein [Candidatus Binatia bacterium]